MQNQNQTEGEQYRQGAADYLYEPANMVDRRTEFNENMIQEPMGDGTTFHSKQFTSSRKYKKRSIILQNKLERKKGAARMAGFMFWTNFVASAFILAGCVCSGWLTFTTTQILYYSQYSYDGYEDQSRVVDVFQDYGLWQVTQCIEPGLAPSCHTLPYRVIDSVYSTKCASSFDCTKIEIGPIEITDMSEILMFSGVGLVFSYSQLVTLETLYVLGLILTMSVLLYWYTFRKDIADGKSISFTKKMWIFVLIRALLSALFVLIPVLTFISVHSQMINAGVMEVKTPYGLILSGSGGLLMAVVTLFTFLQLICCRSDNDVYICSCLTETNILNTEQEG